MSTSRYKNTNASLEEEVKVRQYLDNAIRSGVAKAPTGKDCFAIVYGYADENRKKLLKNYPIIYTSQKFDTFVRRHKQTVLAVFNHNYETQ